jgi:glucosamine-6-phosphate deaminase
MPFRYSLAPFISYRDADVCARVRAIRRADITAHANPAFRIEVIDGPTEFYSRFAIDIVSRIQRARDEGRRCVLILPVGPVPQYAIAAAMINRLRIDCRHLVTFNMDEYADDQGRTAPADWEGSFATSMRQSFFSKIDSDLRPPDAGIHFPTDRNIRDYWKLIEDAGGADCCYGGIGWCGHIAFWESHLGLEFAGDLGGGVSWQRFIARLVAHGPVNELVPGSILQETACDYHILGGVADDVTIEFS